MKKKSHNNNYISFRYTYYCHISFKFAKTREFQSCGFGGLWRFAGNFTKSNSNAENVELFSNALEALVETCLPVDETEEARYLLSFLTRTLIIIHLYDIFIFHFSTFESMLSVSSTVKLSSSLTSISLASPTEKNSLQNPF